MTENFELVFCINTGLRPVEPALSADAVFLRRIAWRRAKKRRATTLLGTLPRRCSASDSRIHRSFTKPA